ncbi:MAG: YncE family protein [Nitrosomonadales bacterium]|nr:YncE family protein [Nitrosomonadales bacterium]MBT7407318.1 YncE family protein [Nitrosomonadales bacterium]MBT7482726.1 YncE family protein [Nitrosomonadales bacterium]MBT7690341.1 YncE family protein [Nitrosomonadales bacterium]
MFIFYDMFKQKKLSTLNAKIYHLFILTFFLIILYFYFFYYFKDEHISKAYITNQGDNTVSIIDLNTLKKIKTLKVGIAPLGITILQNKKLVFVGNVGTDDISVINAVNDKLIKTIKLDTAPLSLASNPDETEVYITDWFKNNVLTISVEEMKVTRSLKVGKTPSGITFNKKHQYQIITNRDANTIEIYNKNYNLVKKLKTGDHPFGVYTIGDFAYTANVYDDSVSVINLIDWSIYDFLVGAHPYNILAHNKIAYITNTVDDTLTIYDLNTKKEIKTLDTGETPENLDLNVKLNLLVVTNWGSNSISIFDTQSLRLIKEIKTGAQSRSFGDFILQ